MKKLLTIILLLFSSVSYAEIILYCTEDVSAGVVKENGNWTRGNFRLDRYTFKFNDDYTTLEAGITGKSVIFDCKPLYGVSNNRSCIDSRNHSELLIFIKNEKRFILASLSPFTGSDTSSDTSVISIGSCESF